MKYLLLFTSAVVTLLSSCGSGSEIKYTNDIESAFAWTDFRNPSIIYTPDAHSGMYVCKLDSSTPFSVTFNMRVEEISKKPFKKLNIGAWIMVAKQEAEPSIVLEVRDASGKTIEWTPFRFTGANVHPRKWERYEADFNLEENNRLQPTNTYRIYVSNGKTDYALVDDIEITFR